MRFALITAATAVMLSFVVNSAPAIAANCAANPTAAIKESEMNFKKMKKSVSKDAAKAYSKAINVAKKSAKAKKNEAACASLADAEKNLVKK